MKTLQQINRLDKLHKLILDANTGTPLQLAEKLEVSRSTLYNMIAYLRDMEAAIHYSRTRKTFYYTKEFHLKIQSLSMLETF